MFGILVFVAMLAMSWEQYVAAATAGADRLWRYLYLYYWAL